MRKLPLAVLRGFKSDREGVQVLEGSEATARGPPGGGVDGALQSGDAGRQTLERHDVYNGPPARRSGPSET